MTMLCQASAAFPSTLEGKDLEMQHALQGAVEQTAHVTEQVRIRALSLTRGGRIICQSLVCVVFVMVVRVRVCVYLGLVVVWGPVHACVYVCMT
jgi:hypothetical protein